MKKFFVSIFFLHLFCQAKTPNLRWAADIESGVPNVFYIPSDPEKVTGFEYDIAQEIANCLGRKLEFVACDWDLLVPSLQRGNCDMVLNAIDRDSWISLCNPAQIALSKPYYITHLQLVVLKTSPFNSFSDCAEHTIGILKQARHAENALKKLQNVSIVIYDDEVKAYDDLKNKRLDGVLLDYPESYYYKQIDSDVRLVKDAFQPIQYVCMVHVKNTDLLAQINAAIDHLKTTGRLKEILQHWALWNNETEQYFKKNAMESYVQAVKETQMDSNHFYVMCLPIFAKAAWVTLKISLVAMFLALLMGAPLGIFRTYGGPFIRCIVSVYIECVRGTPLLVQLLLIYYGLPTLAPYLQQPFSEWVCLSPFVAGVVALAINYSAYEAEIYRAGLLSVPAGQMEAARALGMSHFQALIHVIFPQAFRTIIPPVTNDFIMLLQDSSLVSMITIVELTRTYQCLAATHFNYLQTGLLVAGFYLLLGFPFIRLARYFEKKFTNKIRRNI